VFSYFIIWGLEPVAGSGAQIFWEKASGQLTPIRMPTLFVLSGFLMSSRVRAGFKDRRAVTSAATSYYLYIVWLAVFGLVSLAGLYTGWRAGAVSFRSFCCHGPFCGLYLVSRCGRSSLLPSIESIQRWSW
jgi:hypothetical protein